MRSEQEPMVSNWDSHHTFGFLSELTPAQGLLNRLGREWSPNGSWQMSLLQVKKVVSVLHDTSPDHSSDYQLQALVEPQPTWSYPTQTRYL